MCKPETMQCVKEIEVFDGQCREGCEGLYVTSYFKSEMKEDSFDDFWSKVEADYMQYKGRQTVVFPDELKGWLSLAVICLCFPNT